MPKEKPRFGEMPAGWIFLGHAGPLDVYMHHSTQKMCMKCAGDHRPAGPSTFSIKYIRSLFKAGGHGIWDKALQLVDRELLDPSVSPNA